MGWIREGLWESHEGSTVGVLADGTVPTYKIGDADFERGFDSGFWYGDNVGIPTVDATWIRPDCQCGWKGRDIRWDPARGAELEDQARAQWMEHTNPLAERVEADQAAKAVREVLAEFEQLTPTARLAALRQVQQSVNFWTESSVKAARDQKPQTSWADIGSALGLTRGGAHAKYRALTGEAEDPGELDYGDVFTSTSKETTG